MKVLTVRQPWAHLIMHAGKDIENREWPTNIRGRVAIHSSAKLDWEEWMEAELALCAMDKSGVLPEAILISRPRDTYKFKSQPEGIVLGSILGTVEIVDCVLSSESPWFFGRFGFVLRDPRPFERPIPAKGALGFWEWNEVAA